MLRLLCLALVLAAVAACGGGDDDGAGGASPAETATTPASPMSASRCEPATTEIMTPIGNKITSGTRLRNGQLVKSADHEQMYFVSAELYGTGYEDGGQIATWATPNRFGGGAVYAVDDLAKELSDWRDASEVDVSIDDDGAEASRECVAAAG